MKLKSEGDANQFIVLQMFFDIVVIVLKLL